MRIFVGTFKDVVSYGFKEWQMNKHLEEVTGWDELVVRMARQEETKWKETEIVVLVWTCTKNARRMDYTGLRVGIHGI